MLAILAVRWVQSVQGWHPTLVASTELYMPSRYIRLSYFWLSIPVQSPIMSARRTSCLVKQ